MIRHINGKELDIKPNVDLSRADLSGADFRETIYENDRPINIITEFYPITKCKSFIKIGCEEHTPSEWEAFTDKEISEMAVNALEFWKKYKKLVLMEI